MSNPPAPPVPAARTKGPPTVSPSTPDHLSVQGRATTSHRPTTSPTSSTCARQKAKGTHPWMTLIHPGPWTQLPPAPSPFTPPWSSSLPAQRKGWFKARAPPPNPFAEANQDANCIAGPKAPKHPANQTKRSEPTSQSREDPGRPEERSDTGGHPSSRECSNAANASGTSSEALPFGEPAPSEKPPCEDPPPPWAQTDGSAACPPGLSESNQDSPGESPAAAGLPEGLGDTPKLAQLVGLACGVGVPDMAPASMDSSSAPGLGSLAKDGPLRGLAEGAHPLGSLNLPGAGAMGGVADKAGGHVGPDFAEIGNLGGLASGDTPPASAGFRGLSSLADRGSEVPGVPDLGNALSGLPIYRGADITDGLGVPMGLSGLASELGLPDMAGQATSMEPNPKPAVPRSNTLQASSSSFSSSSSSCSWRPHAPGFPPIKRTVRTDTCVPTEDLQGELGEVNKRLEELELCGVQLESNLRDCKNKKKEEAMLADWMALIQEKQTLLRREAEIAHLTKQKTLEERQADLEYKLRCLFTKPESEWSAEDEAREQKMLEDLVAVIEQRNQIISSLDEDRQREKEDDSVLGAMREKEFQKRGLNELRKSKGRFKPMKVFRMLSAQGSQEFKDKKN